MLLAIPVVVFMFCIFLSILQLVDEKAKEGGEDDERRKRGDLLIHPENE